MGSSNKVRILIYYSYIQAELGNMGGVIYLALCARIIVHHMNIARNIVHPNIIS
jgi:hypothetical protein